MRTFRGPILCSAALASLGLAFASSAQAKAPVQLPHADAAAGWLFVSTDGPVENAHVRALTLGGRDLTVDPGFTGRFGTFSVWTKKLPTRYMLESRDGTVNGLPMRGTLRAIVIDRGADRLVYVNPATTLAAQYAVDHPKLPYATVVARVKRKLGLAPDSTLGESLRRSGRAFDGAQFLAEAARHGGFDAYVRTLAAEIDSKPGLRRPFPTNRHLDEGGNTLAQIGTTVGSGIAKAGLGYLLTQVGLASVSNALGLTSPIPAQLAAISSTLTQIQATLTQITSQLDSLHVGLKTLESEVLTGTYSTSINSLVVAPQMAGLLAIGQSNDTVLNDLNYLAQDAAEVADDTLLLPAAALTNPVGWCATNRKTATQAQQDMCVKINHDIGKGGAPQGADLQAWCDKQRPGLFTRANMAGWSCAILGLVEPYAANLQGEPSQTSAEAATTLYDALTQASSWGADGLITEFDEMTFAQVTRNDQPFLTYATYSQPQDDIASIWETRVALLGGYAAIWDTAENTTPADCLVGGVTTNESVAACDLATASDEATNGVPNALKPDILSLEGGVAIDTRSNVEWLLIEPSCIQGDPILWSWTCGIALGDFAWNQPTVADLQGLIGGWQNWPAGTTTASPTQRLSQAAGFPDLSYLADNQAPPSGNPNGAPAWAGSEVAAAASGTPCYFNQNFFMTFATSGVGLRSVYGAGRFCPTVSLVTGEQIDECVQSTNDDTYVGYDGKHQGCDGTYGCAANPSAGCPIAESPNYDPTVAPYGNHLDYFHPLAVFLEQPVTPEQYWAAG